MCMYVWEGMYALQNAEGQLERSHFSPSTMWVLEMVLSHQIWQCMPLPTTPSCYGKQTALGKLPLN